MALQDKFGNLQQMMFECPGNGTGLEATMNKIYLTLCSLEDYSGNFPGLEYFSLQYMEKLCHSCFNCQQMEKLLNCLLETLVHHIDDNMLHLIGEHILVYLDIDLHDLKKEQFLKFYFKLLTIGKGKEIEPSVIFPLDEMTLYKFVDHVQICRNKLLQKLELQVLHKLLPFIDKDTAQAFFPGEPLLQKAVQNFKSTSFNQGVMEFMNCLHSQDNETFLVETVFITLGTKQYGKNTADERTYVDFNCTLKTVTVRILTPSIEMQPISITISHEDIGSVFTKNFERIDAVELLIHLKKSIDIKELGQSKVKKIRIRFNANYLKHILIYQNNSFLHYFFGTLKDLQISNQRFTVELSDISGQSLTSVGRHLRSLEATDLSVVAESFIDININQETILSKSSWRLEENASLCSLSYSVFTSALCTSSPTLRLESSKRMSDLNDSFETLQPESLSATVLHHEGNQHISRQEMECCLGNVDDGNRSVHVISNIVIAQENAPRYVKNISSGGLPVSDIKIASTSMNNSQDLMSYTSTENVNYRKALIAGSATSSTLVNKSSQSDVSTLIDVHHNDLTRTSALKSPGIIMIPKMSFTMPDMVNLTAANEVCFQSTRSFPSCYSLTSHVLVNIDTDDSYPQNDTDISFYSATSQLENMEIHINEDRPFLQTSINDVEQLIDKKNDNRLNNTVDENLQKGNMQESCTIDCQEQTANDVRIEFSSNLKRKLGTMEEISDPPKRLRDVPLELTLSDIEEDSSIFNSFVEVSMDKESNLSSLQLNSSLLAITPTVEEINPEDQREDSSCLYIPHFDDSTQYYTPSENFVPLQSHNVHEPLFVTPTDQFVQPTTIGHVPHAVPSNSCIQQKKYNLESHRCGLGVDFNNTYSTLNLVLSPITIEDETGDIQPLAAQFESQSEGLQYSINAVHLEDIGSEQVHITEVPDNDETLVGMAPIYNVPFVTYVSHQVNVKTTDANLPENVHTPETNINVPNLPPSNSQYVTEIAQREDEYYTCPNLCDQECELQMSVCLQSVAMSPIAVENDIIQPSTPVFEVSREIENDISCQSYQPLSFSLRASYCDDVDEDNLNIAAQITEVLENEDSDDDSVFANNYLVSEESGQEQVKDAVATACREMFQLKTGTSCNNLPSTEVEQVAREVTREDTEDGYRNKLPLGCSDIERSVTNVQVVPDIPIIRDNLYLSNQSNEIKLSDVSKPCAINVEAVREVFRELNDTPVTNVCEGVDELKKATSDDSDSRDYTQYISRDINENASLSGNVEGNIFISKGSTPTKSGEVLENDFPDTASFSRCSSVASPDLFQSYDFVELQSEPNAQFITKKSARQEILSNVQNKEDSHTIEVEVENNVLAEFLEEQGTSECCKDNSKDVLLNDQDKQNSRPNKMEIETEPLISEKSTLSPFLDEVPTNIASETQHDSKISEIRSSGAIISDKHTVQETPVLPIAEEATNNSHSFESASRNAVTKHKPTDLNKTIPLPKEANYRKGTENSPDLFASYDRNGTQNNQPTSSFRLEVTPHTSNDQLSRSTPGHGGQTSNVSLYSDIDCSNRATVGVFSLSPQVVCTRDLLTKSISPAFAPTAECNPHEYTLSPRKKKQIIKNMLRIRKYLTRHEPTVRRSTSKRKKELLHGKLLETCRQRITQIREQRGKLINKLIDSKEENQKFITKGKINLKSFVP